MQTTVTVKKLMGGKLRLERRNDNPMIYARTYFQGKSMVFRTGETRLVQASKVAEDWWFGLRDRVNKGEQLHDLTFADCAEKFLAVCEHDHNPGQVKNFVQKWSVLKPFFGEIKPQDVDLGWLQQLRIERTKESRKKGKAVKPATLKKDFIFIRLVLKHAIHQLKSLDRLPEFPPFRRNTKWEIREARKPPFNAKEYKYLLKTAWRRMRQSRLNRLARRRRTELYYQIHIMTGAALRPSEAYSLRWTDCDLYLQDDSDLTEQGRRGEEVRAAWLLDMQVLGKHSYRSHRTDVKDERENARGNALAACAFMRLKASRGNEWMSDPEANLFQEDHQGGFNDLVNAAGLWIEPKTGRTRDLRSLRPTGITQRLEDSAKRQGSPDYRDVKIWARTSVAMVEKCYDRGEYDDAAARLMTPKPRYPEPPRLNTPD